MITPYADGIPCGPSIYLSELNEWKHKWEGLPKYKMVNSDRVEIEYIVKEDIVDGYFTAYDVSTDESGNKTIKIKNTYSTERGSYDIIIDKLDSYTNKNLNGAEFKISAEKDGEKYELFDKNGNEIAPGKITIDGELVIKDVNIFREETYTIILEETKAPEGYMLLDEAIKIKVTTGINESYTDEKFVVESVELIDNNNHNLVSISNEDKSINIVAKNEYFDLALRKSITSVEYSDSNEAKITQDQTKDRIPFVDKDDELFNGNNTTAHYGHVKNHVGVYTEQEVIFTLRVYNEGEIDGYAEEITDHLPEGLEFVNDEFNAERGWTLDINDKSLRTVKTTYLSKDNNPDNDRFNAKNNLIRALDSSSGNLDYKEIEIKCKISSKVAPGTVLTNIAEISLSKANDRTSETIDRDSHTTPGAEIPEDSEKMQNYKENELTDNRNDYVPGQEDDDDFEKLIVNIFDLALRKYITEVNGKALLNTSEDDAIYEREPRVNVSSLKDGTSSTATYTHTKEPVLVSVGDVVTYTLEVFNEGTVDGYAELIKDDIPEGLEFITYEVGDGSINDIYRWKMLDENDNEVTDISKAKYVVSDYLSKSNEKSVEENLIRAFESNLSKPNSKYVKVEFKVACAKNFTGILKNEAQISKDADRNGESVKDRDSHTNQWLEEDDEDVEFVKVTYMDLALRKFITGVTDGSTGVTQEVTSRIPEVNADALIKETGTTAEYNHTKEPVLVHTSDTVIYTIRVYNEGSRSGYATQIKDDLPDGLEYLPNHEINKEYEWVLVDKNDNPVTNLKDAEYAVTNYLSKEKESDERQNLMNLFNKDTMKNPEYKDVKIAFKVIEPTTSDRVLVNEAQISEQTDESGNHREDRDSTPNEWLEEDDEDIEKIRVQYFDLALRKWVTKAIVTQDGEEKVIETGHHAEDDPEDVVKVDLKKSKINKVVVKFEYKIRITNEGEIEGYAKEIKDYIPEGLRFDPADNPTWTQISENVVTTEQLKDTLLKPGDSAEVSIILTWINSGSNLGLKVNTAEISKDYNDYGTHDIDSTPDNYVAGEDDIDDAPIMLALKTGNVVLGYTILGLVVVSIIAVGVKAIKNGDGAKN